MDTPNTTIFSSYLQEAETVLWQKIGASKTGIAPHLIVACIGLVGAWLSRQGMKHFINTPMYLLNIALLCVSIIVVFVPAVLLLIRKDGRTSYALTDKRLIVLNGSMWSFDVPIEDMTQIYPKGKLMLVVERKNQPPVCIYNIHNMPALLQLMRQTIEAHR